ncbi:MAG: nuclear transport factor 2 family protein [Pseudomonadota bacterium]
MTDNAKHYGKADSSEETRRVALAFFESMEDINAIDTLLAPDAKLWVVGTGELERSKFISVHKPLLDRPAPLSSRTTLLGLVVEGERASIEMEWEVSWSDLTYHQFYHHVLMIRDGKIYSIRMYSDRDEGKKLFSAEAIKLKH